MSASATRTAPQQTRSIAAVWLLIVAICVVVAFITRMWLATLPIITVEVHGNFKYLQKAELVNQAKQFIEQGMLSLDSEALRETLLQDAWVDSLTVRKRWPNTVIVNVTEQTPLAYWQSNALVNLRGEVFAPKEIPADLALPRLFGDTGEGEQVFAAYQAVNSVLRSRDMAIKAIHKSAMGNYQVKTMSGLELVFEASALQPQLSKFIDVFDRYLQQGVQHIAAVDLRYSNGLSVAWQAPANVKSNLLAQGEFDEG